MSGQIFTTQASHPAEITVTTWSTLLRTHQALTRELNARLFADHGLTLSDYEALLHLSHAEDCSMRRVDLAERMLLSPSGVTRLLDGLEREGWVTKAKCAEDARVTYAVLTDEGRERFEAAARSHLRQVRVVLEERFAREELETLAELLGRLPGGPGDGESCSP